MIAYDTDSELKESDSATKKYNTNWLTERMSEWLTHLLMTAMQSVYYDSCLRIDEGKYFKESLNVKLYIWECIS